MRLLIGFIVLLFAVGLAIVVPKAWHDLTCKRGHYETINVPGAMHTAYGFTTNGDMTTSFYWLPEHQERAWVCDE